MELIKKIEYSNYDDNSFINIGTRMNGELLRFYLHNTNPNW